MRDRALDLREFTVEELDWVGGGGDRVDAIIAGAAIGAGISGPAAAGAMIGASFAGVGAVPGSAIGAGIGWVAEGIVGVIAGGWAGKKVFEWAKPPAGSCDENRYHYRVV